MRRKSLLFIDIFHLRRLGSSYSG